MKRMILLDIIIIFLIVWFWPAGNTLEPEYGATFSARYASDLTLDPKEVYEEMLRDLGVKKVRLVAYWDEIEAEKDNLDFSNLDWQIDLSEEYGAEVILTVGRRVPRWPECHVPSWVYEEENDKEEELKEFVGQVVERYKDRDVIKYWQIENEAFFVAYASEICGVTVDIDLIDEELELVRELDPTRQIIMTDSGNLGFWGPAFKRGDIFGSTFYVYLMLDGELRTPLTHNFYKLKKGLWELIYGEKETFLIEISVEPWLQDPILEVDVDELKDRLSIERVENIVKFARDTEFSEQYFWGLEWHYYMKKEGHPEYWDFMKELY